MAGLPSLNPTALPGGAPQRGVGGTGGHGNGTGGSGAGPSAANGDGDARGLSNAEATAQLAKQGPGSWLKFM